METILTKFYVIFSIFVMMLATYRIWLQTNMISELKSENEKLLFLWRSSVKEIRDLSDKLNPIDLGIDKF